MPWIRPHRDEIDAVLGDDLLDDDLADVAAIVHDLRSAYLRDEPLPRHPALQAFAAMPAGGDGDPLAAGERQTSWAPNRAESTGAGTTTRARTRTRVVQTATALLATLAGKVALGTAIAAASVGGLHATAVVDVPGLPDRSAEPAEEPSEAPESRGGQPDRADPPVGADHPGGVDGTTGAQETTTGAQAKQEAAEQEFTADMESWTDCADDPDEPDATERSQVDRCGEPPRPGDYGLTGPPTDRADEPGADEGTPAPGAPGGDPGNDPGDRAGATPPDPPADDAQGGPDDAPDGQGEADPRQSPSDEAAARHQPDRPPARR